MGKSTINADFPYQKLIAFRQHGHFFKASSRNCTAGGLSQKWFGSKLCLRVSYLNQKHLGNIGLSKLSICIYTSTIYIYIYTIYIYTIYIYNIYIYIIHNIYICRYFIYPFLASDRSSIFGSFRYEVLLFAVQTMSPGRRPMRSSPLLSAFGWSETWIWCHSAADLRPVGLECGSLGDSTGTTGRETHFGWDLGNMSFTLW